MSSRRALSIEHESEGGPALVGHFLEERGYSIVNHIVTKDTSGQSQLGAPDPYPSLDGFDLIIIGGSEQSLTRKDEIEAWIHDELDLVRRAHAARTPILGICFGGQVISEALGGDVEVAPVTEIGWYEIEGEANPVGRGPWFEWHHDRFTPPSGAEILASNQNAVQLFRMGSTVGTQFHPEVTERHLEAWTQKAPASYLESHGVTADQIMSDAMEHHARNHVQTKRLVDWFVEEVVVAAEAVAS